MSKVVECHHIPYCQCRAINHRCTNVSKRQLFNETCKSYMPKGSKLVENPLKAVFDKYSFIGYMDFTQFIDAINELKQKGAK